MRTTTTPFHVRLADIPQEGWSRAYDLGGAFAEQALAGTEVSAADLSAEVTLFKTTATEVLLRGHLAGHLRVLCSRCAGPADVTVGEDFQVLFVPLGSEVDAPDEDELATDEPDMVPYTGEEIDIGETLREEILLALPLAPLCAETCRGLCPRCGADLNQGACDCPAEPGRDDRWAALRNVKL